MPNPNGLPIWYELQALDADAAKAFYEAVVGWEVAAPYPGEIDYRTIATAGDGNVGGLMKLTDELTAAGAKPGWKFYVGVEDVDATAARIKEKGGQVLVGPWDMPDVGRMAIVVDRQGIVFYVMRGASEESSTAFDRFGLGKCNWNELATSDQASANAFYADVFGWTYPDRMTMPGDMGDYIFIDVAGRQIGATMTAMQPGPAPDWRFYFRTPDIEVAAQAVRDNGGTVHMGPVDVPGGDRIIVASDPAGTAFGIVSPATQA